VEIIRQAARVAQGWGYADTVMGGGGCGSSGGLLLLLLVVVVVVVQVFRLGAGDGQLR
jgi:hypothetical protein